MNIGQGSLEENAKRDMNSLEMWVSYLEKSFNELNDIKDPIEFWRKCTNIEGIIDFLKIRLDLGYFTGVEKGRYSERLSSLKEETKKIGIDIIPKAMNEIYAQNAGTRIH